MSRKHLMVTHNLIANLVEISMYRSQLTELQTTLRDREATIQEMTAQNEGLESKVGRLCHALLTWKGLEKISRATNGVECHALVTQHFWTLVDNGVVSALFRFSTCRIVFRIWKSPRWKNISLSKWRARYLLSWQSSSYSYRNLCNLQEMFWFHFLRLAEKRTCHAVGFGRII